MPARSRRWRSSAHCAQGSRREFPWIGFKRIAQPVLKRPSFTDEEALAFHAQGKPGKIEITPTKPMATQRDLSLAYSPGVAVPVRAIAERPDAVFDYTAKGNFVAVVSNGTAILGLGDLGPLAAKPVMEGKAVLFKRFADVDAIDLEIDTTDVEAFINCVRYLGPSFGGINLEDIKAPDCFIIEERLRELMDIPVFHDDQHGTAIISAAGVINALHLTGRKIADIKVVVNGAGAAGIARLELARAAGLLSGNAILSRFQGCLIVAGRTARTSGNLCTPSRWPIAPSKMRRAWLRRFARASVKGAVTPETVKSMAKAPIIFAMANPDPEITPEEARMPARPLTLTLKPPGARTIPIWSTTCWHSQASFAARSTCGRARSTKR